MAQVWPWGQRTASPRQIIRGQRLAGRSQAHPRRHRSAPEGGGAGGV